MGTLITNVNFSKKETRFFDKVKKSAKHFVSELEAKTKALSQPKEETTADKSERNFRMVTLTENSDWFKSLMKTTRSTELSKLKAEPEASIKKIIENVVTTMDQGTDLTMAELAHEDDFDESSDKSYFDEDDSVKFEDLMQSRTRKRDREQLTALFRVTEHYRAVVAELRQELEQRGVKVNLKELADKKSDELSEDERLLQYNAARLNQIHAMIAEKFYTYGCSYGVTAINEEDFKLVSDAYADSLTDQTDARLVREFMQCAELSAPIRVTLFHKLFRDQATIDDLWSMASLSNKSFYGSVAQAQG